jgi:hypothetical protein
MSASHKPRTVPKSPRVLGNARGVCSPVVHQVEFEPLEHSVYHYHQLLGRYTRIGVGCVAAFDASGIWLGDYSRPGEARSAILRRSQRRISRVQR